MEQTIEEKYKQLHREMINRYKIKEVLQREIANAALLEDFLRNLKRVILNRPTNLSILDEKCFNLLYGQLKENFHKISPSNAKLENLLFHQTGQGFENEVTTLHQISELILGIPEKMSKKDINIGNVSANILNSSETIRIEEAFVKKINDLCNSTIDELVGADFKRGIVKKGRSGKIDVRGNKNIKITYTIEGVPEPSVAVWQLLASSNFTLKNKKSLAWDIANKQITLEKDSKIKLGNTTSYVAIVGMISALEQTLDTDLLNKYFYGGITEGVVNGNNEVAEHLNHLQFAYEISGAGQFYGEGLGDLGETDYLIYNDPDSDDIVVKSVKAFICEILEEKNGTYSREVAFLRRNKGRNRLTKKAKKNYNRYS